MSKTNGILVLLFVILSAFFAFQYQSIMATDSRQGEIISQIRLTEVEYNSSEPLICLNAENGEFFECNFTIENPTNHSVTLLSVSATYQRETPSLSLYLIARGSCSYNLNLDPRKYTFTLKMYCLTYTEKPPPSIPTTARFHVDITVKYGFSARILWATVSDSTVESTWVVARPLNDETYPLLFMYPVLIIGTWTIGTGATLIVEFTKAKEVRKIEQLASANFLLFALFVFSILLLPSLYFPPPYRVSEFSPPATGGLAGLTIFVEILFRFVIASNMITAIGFFLHRRWARTLALAIFILFILSIFYANLILGLFIPSFADISILILFISFAIIGATTTITVLKLRKSS
jgi:hypothetical protein